MSTLDNYIAESVSEDVSVGDIYVEQALAQLNVAYSLVASYAKDVAYVEYMAEMNGVDIYQEGFFEESDKGDGGSDDKGKKEPGKLKKFGKSLLSGPRKIWSFIKAAAEAVATAATNLWRFITEKSLKTCIKKLEATESTKTYKIPQDLEHKCGHVIHAIEFFSDNVADAIKSMASGGGFEYKTDPILSLPSNTGLKSVTPKELAAIIKKITAVDAETKLRESIKSLKDSINKINKNNKGEQTDRKELKQAKDVNSRVYKTFYESSKTITTVYSSLLKDLKHVSNQVLKEVKKDSKNSGGGNPEPPKNDEGDGAGDGNGGGDE